MSDWMGVTKLYMWVFRASVDWCSLSVDIVIQEIYVIKLQDIVHSVK